MLRRVGAPVDGDGAITTVKDASFPAPFASELEFNSPVHGTWNIVHIGMAVPETRQIYVCADNCMRGVVLTAAEMHAADRFSFVIVEEEHLLNGNLEDVTIEGVTDVLERLDEKPKMVLLFTVCLHHFLGCDLDRVYEELDRRFPDIFFARCYMDPIMQKHGMTPEQKLRKAMFDALPERPADPGAVSILGGDFALAESSELIQYLKARGCRVRQLQDCRTWEDYLALGESGLLICCYPTGQYGVRALAERLGRDYLYMPASFGYQEIARQMDALATAWGQGGCEGRGMDRHRGKDGDAFRAMETASGAMETASGAMETASGAMETVAREQETASGERETTVRERIAACEAALAQALAAVGSRPIAIDYTVHPRPLGLARLLISHGFSVKTVYLDAISPEEEADFLWLQSHAPELTLAATIQVKMRVMPRQGGEDVLAIGQKAAWFTGSRHFVNVVQGGDLHGFDGICRLAAWMAEAVCEEKATEALVIRKGWGCESCI